MSYSMQYWRRAWNNAPRGLYSNDDTAKSLDLLSRYAGFYKSFLVFGIVGKSHYGRFFSGRWRTQHADQVESAIANFYHVDGMCLHDKRFHYVEYILARVKQTMGDRPINPDGSLAKILAVIGENTGVEYANLDAETVIRNYEQSTIIPHIDRSNLTLSTAEFVEVPMSLAVAKFDDGTNNIGETIHARPV